MSDNEIRTPVDRERVSCPVCGAEPGQPCEFPDGETWTVVEDGVSRRVVHAGRYVRTLTEAEAHVFWETAVEKYVVEQLSALEPEMKAKP